MKILSVYPLPGISYSHDPNVAIVSDQGILFAAEEERFLRSQHAIGHVADRAALLALEQTGLEPASFERLVVTSLESCWRRPDYSRRLQFIQEQLLLPPAIPVTCVTHHLAHTALAVLSSPFDECAFLTLDAGGDDEMGQWGTYSNGRFRILGRFDLSPAHLYQFLTCVSGFPLFEEGKVMGLAAYGQVCPDLLTWLRSHFRVAPDSASLQTDLTYRWDGRLHLRRLDLDRFARHKYLRWRLEFREHGDAGWVPNVPPPDVARTAQVFFEELLTSIVRHVVRRTGMRRVACAGGAFLNVAANGVIPRVVEGTELFVPVAPHDAGLALGAALWVQHRYRRPRPVYPVTPLLGPRFSTDQVESVLREYGLSYERPADFAGAVAALIAAGRIVGWFNGRAEYGARALGARSVLADPRDVRAKARLNQLLKKRDWFMPFAPSVLEDYAPSMFEDFSRSPYMNTAFRVRPGAVRLIPAAVHADGTCRAHLVSAVVNPDYHDVIARFREMTGVPAVLNTSFNRHGLPMVATPRDAIHHLLEGCVDVLAIEGLLVPGHPRCVRAELLDETESLSIMLLRHAARLLSSGQYEAAGAVLPRVNAALRIDGLAIWHGDVCLWTAPDPVDGLERAWLERRRN